MSNGAPSYSQLITYHRRVEAMIVDPECSGDLMLIGVALARWVDLGLPVHAKGEELTWKTIGEMVLKRSRTGNYYVKQTLRKDIRRYEAAIDNGSHFFQARCGAPMIRRQGPCGASASRRMMVSDKETGRQSWLAACARHADWFQSQRLRAIEVEPARRPFANTGGVLARHLPEIEWEDTYRKLDPKWEPSPEGTYEDEDLLAIDRPRLRLIIGGAS